MRAEGNLIVDKSKAFAIQIVRLYKYLVEEQKEYVLSKQLLRSGTSIGANVAEAIHGQSAKDFYAKFCIAEKETNETLYWLELLYAAEYLDEQRYTQYRNECVEILRIIIAICKSTKRNM